MFMAVLFAKIMLHVMNNCFTLCWWFSLQMLVWDMVGAGVKFMFIRRVNIIQTGWHRVD
jgi:hypothetical protein